MAGLRLADAEHRLADEGVRTAWLACAPGNARAVAFYKKAGWVPIGEVIEALDTAEGVFELPVIRFEKQVSSGYGTAFQAVLVGVASLVSKGIRGGWARQAKGLWP